MKKDASRGTEEVWPVIKKLLGDEKSILDVGCGEHVWEHGLAEITRCDNGQFYPDREGALEGCDDVNLNDPWPYKRGAFGSVVAADVVEHLENPWHFFREASRAARNSVIISTPNVESPMSRALFMRSGQLWGFCENEREQSHHITPIFSWLINAAVEAVNWKVKSVIKVSKPVPDNRALKLRIEDFARSAENERWIVAMAVPKEGDFL